MVFNRFGDREPVVQIYQYRCELSLTNTPMLIYSLNTCVSHPVEEEVNVNETQLPPPFAFVDAGSGGLKYTGSESAATVFPSGVPRAAEELFIHVAVFVLYTVLCLLGVAFAVACVLFNLLFRKKRCTDVLFPLCMCMKVE